MGDVWSQSFHLFQIVAYDPILNTCLHLCRMSTIYFTLELHFGGKFEWEPHVVYNGGSVALIDNCDLDRMSLFEIRDLYKEAGGEGIVVDYYFRVPGYPLDIGTMRLNSDKDVSRMLEMYTGLPVVIVYAEKVGYPLIAISP